MVDAILENVEPERTRKRDSSNGPEQADAPSPVTAADLAIFTF